ncbi:MAG: SgcJ/EcaC family oxidoreductase [Betaproteobacteria bacterium]|nr:SgcJ/EcaC family oxidoreductase [Betaproteobacteria bacterium]
MSAFREALGRHLLAIEERDLDALAATVAPDGVLLVMADGRLVRSTEEFLRTHREWFAMKNWRLEVKPVHVYESAALGVALLHLEYREHPPDRPPTRQLSLLTLVFQNRNGKWLMFQDQNTPIQK